MKKRILALLLAGLITASMASCVSSGKRPDLGGPDDTGGSEETQSRQEEETTDPNLTVTWNDASGTFYVVSSSLTLTPVTSGGQSIKVKLMDELTRVKISSDEKRSIVEVDGVQYYVSNTYLSDQDLPGKKFTSCNIKMYAISEVNIRAYASIDEFSTVIAGLKKGDEVTVIGQGESSGMNWCKIQYVGKDEKTHEYFVSAKYLSEDPNAELTDYSQYFTACDPEEIWYVNDQTEHLNLRDVPSVEADSQIKLTINKGDAVTVIKKGTGDYQNWFYIRFPDEKQEGLPQTYTEYYVNKTGLTETKVELSLDELIEKYGFTKEATPLTRYTTGNLNVRKSPEVIEGNTELVGLTKAAKITVLANGIVDGKQWSIFEYSTGVYRFVRSSYLTTSSDGTEVPTLQTLLENNPEFTQVTAITVYAKEKAVGITSFDNDKTTKEFPKDTAVTKVAEGTKSGARWYIVKDSTDTYYFVGANFFTEDQVLG